MHEKVSVVIPTFKRSSYLERAIDSVINQTYNNVEIVIVDDNDPGSIYRIETEKKMEKYVSDKNIKYIRNEKNLGGALARNEGIFNSTGNYITFLDDDDLYLPEKIEVQVQWMKEKGVDLSFSDVRFHNKNDILVDYREHSYVKSLSNQDLLKQHIMHHLTPTGTYMFRREALISIGAFDDVQMGQEFMLMLKSIEKGLNIGYMKGALIIQFLHDGERISVGHNKILKEIELYNFKKKYFGVLSSKERRYVKFRHHAVMMIAGKRSKKYKVALKNLANAVLTSPIDCVAEVINHKRKIGNYKNVK